MLTACWLVVAPGREGQRAPHLLGGERPAATGSVAAVALSAGAVLAAGLPARYAALERHDLSHRGLHRRWDHLGSGGAEHGLLHDASVQLPLREYDQVMEGDVQATGGAGSVCTAGSVLRELWRHWMQRPERDEDPFRTDRLAAPWRQLV